MPRTYKSRLSLKVHAWPCDDRRAWTAALERRDILDDPGAASHLSPASIAWMTRSYGHYLAWLRRNEILKLDSPATEHVVPELLVRYLVDLEKTYASSSIADFIQKILLVARILAPKRDWSWLERVWRRRKKLARPARDKRPRMVEACALYEFGLELMEKGEAAKFVLESALLYRDGLMIALLAARPLRRRNLSGIEIGKHLVTTANGYELRFAAKETKTGHLFEAELPHELVPHMERYRGHFRTLLFPRNRGSKQALTLDPSACSHLWVSSRGQKMSTESIYRAITVRTRAKFGRSVNPHLFRDVGATSLAIHDPEHVRSSRSLLGHATFATTERHYILATSVQATNRHQATILALRSRGRDDSGGNRGAPNIKS